MKQTLKKLWQLPKSVWDFLLRSISNLCGGEISGKNIALAIGGFFAAVSLILALVFLTAIVYIPHY